MVILIAVMWEATLFDIGQALIRVCLLIVSLEKFIEKVNKDWWKTQNTQVFLWEKVEVFTLKKRWLYGQVTALKGS